MSGRYAWMRLPTGGFAADQRGVISVEFALAAVFLMTAMLNAADVGEYIYQSMQVENAAQMAVQTVLQTCTSTQLPATTACPGLSGRVASAVAATSLGTAITIDGGQITEAYYCTDSSYHLVQVGTIGSRPSTCATAGNAALVPGDYVVAAVSFSFKPLTSGASVATLLSTSIKRSAVMRIG